MQRMTLLEAINTMLLDIRMAPLASLEPTEEYPVGLGVYHEGTLAYEALVSKTREVLSRGWNFNSKRTSLSPSAETSEIQIEDYEGVIDVWAGEGDIPCYMQDDGYLFNMEKNSTIFDRSVTCTIVYGLTFENLPTPLQSLCLAEARIKFSGQQRPGEAVGQALSNELAEAKTLAFGWDSRQKRRNMLDNLMNRVHTNRNFPRRG